jgi:hypothetical protein
MTLRRIHVLAAGALVALAAACKDSQGPGSFSDPSAVTAELHAMDSAFASAAFQSYAEVSDLIAPTATGSLRAAALLIEGTTPQLADEPAYARGARRAEALRRAVPYLASRSGPIIPDILYGTTFEWDTATNAYVATARAGASAQGVRFILYTVNSITQQPVEPLVEVGHVDLIDESAGNTLRLHIRVQGVGGTPTYLDYTATITVGSSSFTATVNGSLSNGEAAAANKTLTYTAAFQANSSSVTENASFDLNAPSVSVDVFMRLTASASALTVTVDTRFARPGELVRMTGSVTLTPSGNTLTLTANVAVTVNGGIVARLQGDPTTAQWVKHDSTPLTADELEALEEFFDAVERFFDFLEDLLEPIDEIGS